MMRQAGVLIIAILCASGLAGCAAGGIQGGGRGAFAGSEEALLETGLRCALQGASSDELIFLSTSRRISGWKDPPRAMIAWLSDLKLRLKPASGAVIDRFDGVVDKATGKNGVLYWAEIKERISETRIRLEVGHWAGMLSGGGEIVVYQFRDGHWVQEEGGTAWIS